MLGLLRQTVKTLRNVDQQLQQVVDIVHPGPLASSVQRWTPEAKVRASKAVERAIDTWYTRHGVSQAPWGRPRPTQQSSSSSSATGSTQNTTASP
ncbi:hypothetical protein Ndes2437B_g04102 [Nannochloris sp. 'desiccata']